MSRKLSKKEEGELVTKGFLYNDFKKELVQELNEVIDTKISVQTGVLMEDFREHMKGMMEAMNMRFEMQDRRFERMEKKHDDTMDWLQNHEKRISKLEYKH